MFSGIVQTKSEGHESSKTDSGIKLKITSNESFYLNIKKGDSVSVDGVCLTVTDFGKNYAFFDVIPETLRCTSFLDSKFLFRMRHKAVLTAYQDESDESS